MVAEILCQLDFIAVERAVRLGEIIGLESPSVAIVTVVHFFSPMR
jgi:hypothetical protein